MVFHPGLNIITGHTGSGKSMMFLAIDFALGLKTKIPGLEDEQKQVDVSIEIDTSHLPQIKQWLSEQQLDTETLIIRRVQSKSRSMYWINGQRFTKSILNTIQDELIDRRHQHDPFEALSSAQQLTIVDQFAQLMTARAHVDMLYNQWQQHQQRIDQYQRQRQHRQERMDLLAYYCQEFDPIDWSISHESLVHKHQQMHQFNRVKSAIVDLINHLEHDPKIVCILEKHVLNLTKHLDVFPNLESTCNHLHHAIASIQECIYESKNRLDEYHNQSENQAIIDDINQRIELARKHRVDPHDLNDHIKQLYQEYQQLQDQQVHESDDQQLCQQARDAYHQAALDLHQKRCHHSDALVNAWIDLMPSLGIEHSKAAITWQEPCIKQASSSGISKPQFHVSCNPDQPLSPLHQGPSGGELTRIALILMSLGNHQGPAKSMILDEIDVGIGGSVASAMGKLLKSLAEHRQIILITHQPQVAAYACQHMRVDKTIEQGITKSSSTICDHIARTKELARMLDHDDEQQTAMAHARAILESSINYKLNENQT